MFTFRHLLGLWSSCSLTGLVLFILFMHTRMPMFIYQVFSFSFLNKLQINIKFLSDKKTPQGTFKVNNGNANQNWSLHFHLNVAHSRHSCLHIDLNKGRSPSGLFRGISLLTSIKSEQIKHLITCLVV